MSDAVERLLVRIDATSEQLRRELKKADEAVTKSNTVVQRATAAMGRSWAKADKYVKRHNTELKLLGVAAAGAMGLALKSIVSYSDNYKQLQGQLKLVTDSQEELNDVWNKALSLSNATGASIDSTVNLYARLARSTEELNLSQNELFTITEAVNQSFVVSGASAQEADSAILQLSQGLAAGALRGEELNSVMENSPRLARALADGLGVSIGQLREMGAAGELTAEKVTGALLQMSGQIKNEFAEMPMTVARATNEVKNLLADAFGKTDLSPLIAEIDRFGDAVSDPRVTKGLTDIAAAIVNVSVAAAKAVAIMPALTKWLSERLAAAVGGPAADDMDAIASRIQDLTGWIEKATSVGEGNTAKVKKWREELATLNRVYALNLELITENTKAKAKETKATEKVAKVYGKLNKITVTATKVKSKYGVQANKVLAALKFESEQLQRTGREQFIFNQLQKSGVMTSEEQKQAIREVAGALYDQEQALLAVSDAANKSEAAAAKVDNAWTKAMQDTAARIDEAFAGAWRGAFDSFSDFADGLKDAFKNLLAELAHMAITRPIIMQMGAAFGLGSASGAATAAGGVSAVAGGSGILSGVSGAAMSGFAGLGNAYQQTGIFLRDAGLPGANAAFNTGLDYATKPLSTNLANLGLNVGTGFAGSYLGGQVFGDTSGLGSFAGGAVGSIFGPVGTGVGSFLGTGIEKALGNVFGFGGKGGNQAGLSDFNLLTGTANTRGSGKSFDQANVDAAGNIVAVMQDFANMLGGSDFSGRIKIGNKSGLKMDGKKYGSPEELIGAAFDQIIAGAKNLTPTIKKLLTAFDGTADEVLVFSASILSISELMKSNPVDAAVDDFANALEASGRSIMDTYSAQLSELDKLVGAFDGSAESAAALNMALSVNKQLAYDMALALQAIGESTKTIVSGQVDYFLDKVRTPDERLRAQQAELESLFSILPTLADPTEIENTRNRLLELNRAIFDAGPDDLQRSNVDTYIDFANAVGDATQAALTASMESIGTTQDELNAGVQAALEGAAASFQVPADTMQSAATIFSQAVQDFINSGRYTEVSA